MKTLVVYADFDWLDSPKIIGELGYESLRGSDSYSFKFDTGWLRTYGELFLSADLNNYPGYQYTKPEKDIFGCFSDALPDRWGRLLLNRREQILASESKRSVRKLSSFDYLTGLDDYSRMGGFRFKESADGDFINTSTRLRLPPLTELRSLAEAASEIEKGEELNVLPDGKWLKQLLLPGTSLGGARPKAVVVDTDGVLYMAKFPSRTDDYDVALWEHLSHLLAKQSGIDVPKTSMISTGQKYHTFLSQRFDRTKTGKRIHYASAMTLLGLSDGDNANAGYGYLDIVDFIIQNCCDVEYNLRQLFRRVAFNVAIGNSDDHFRNHGFLLTRKGWTLSPAFDLNPSDSGYQSLLITPSSSRSDLGLLMESSEYYMIERSEAKQIIGEIKDALGYWERLASRIGISKSEIDLFRHIFSDRV